MELSKQKKKKEDAAKEKSRSILSRLLSIFTVLTACVVLLIPISIGVFIHFNSPPPIDNIPLDLSEHGGIEIAADGSIYFEVRRGESAQSVGRRLERASLIGNRYFWQLLNRLGGEHLRVGTYRIEVPANQLAIYQLLVSGRQVLHRVTIPEGMTIRRTALILEEAGICSAEDFIAAARDPQILSRFNIPNSTMEGYLFPDTYMFPLNFPATNVVIAMAENFFARLEEIYPEFVNMTPAQLNERVILASIVEREYRVAEEAPIMAGVFNNRLRIGMMLQSCATVEYIITEILGRPHPRVIFYRDLEIRNPFNTYMYRGLPPGPISMPGTVALNAAFFPAQTEYLFFRLIDVQTGRHHFSRTLDEHIRAGQLAPRG